MEISIKPSKDGFSTSLLKNSRVKYPDGIWSSLKKETGEIIAENAAYLKVSPYAIFFDEEFYFDFSRPYLSDLGDKGMIIDMPRIAAEDKISAKQLIEKFKSRRTRFKDNDAKRISETEDIEKSDSALIAMSFGKDSLLSYGVAKEIGLDPKLVMVQDFWDIEAKHKMGLIKRFEKEFKEHITIMYDQMDDLSSSRKLNKDGSEGIVNANAMNAYMTMLLPVAMHARARYIVFGNEQSLNDYFIDDEGLKVYPSYDQSSQWMQEQNRFLKGFTGDRMQVASLIEPLHNIAEVRILFERYPEIARYQMSCALMDAKGTKERWCYKCPMCARTFIYLTAAGVDPKAVSFNRNFLEKRYKNMYPLFNKGIKSLYEKPQAVRDEQLLAFYLSSRKGAKGYLMGYFKKNFLDEAKEREDELFKRFFGIHNSLSIQGKIKNMAASIYKEELNKVL